MFVLLEKPMKDRCSAIKAKIRLTEKEAECAWRCEWNIIFDKINPMNKVNISSFLKQFEGITIKLIRTKSIALTDVLNQIAKKGPNLNQQGYKDIKLYILDYFSEDNYLKRWDTFYASVVRKFSRYGIDIDRLYPKIDVTKSCFNVGVINNIRDAKAYLNAEYILLADVLLADAERFRFRKLLQCFELKPSFYGFGLNLNAIIEKIFYRFQNKLIFSLLIAIFIFGLDANAFAESDRERCYKAYKANKFKEAYPICLSAAEAGDAEAQSNVGSMLRFGDGTAKNETKAVEWYLKSASQGYSKAFLYLGIIHDDIKNIDKSKKYFEAAVTGLKASANLGDSTAQNDLGEMYMSGIGVNQDYAEAAKWYHMAAEQGVTKAQYWLGLMYENSMGVKQDYSEAINWYRKAAMQSDVEAQYNLGLMYQNGIGAEVDYTEAEYWYLQAARQGDANAQNNLGVMYQYGTGVRQDYTEAVSWYRKAAKLERRDAQSNLGYMYYSGKGVPKSFKEAFNWYKKAAYNEHKESQWQLGYMYAAGEGVEQDNVKALAWFTLASTNDAEKAELRDNIEKSLKPSEVQQAQKLAIKLDADIKQWREQQLAAIFGIKNQSATPKNKFTALAIPNNIKPTFTSNDYAVVIGIEKYRTVPPTEFASEDARMVHDYLKALGIPAYNIELLADDRATLSDIRKVIETKLPSMVKSNSRVVVYFAGHGAPSMVQGESYIVPYDGDPSFLTDTAYPLSRLYDRLSRLQVKEILVILDSCFSGSGGRSVIAKNTRPLVMFKDTPPPTSGNMIVLTSSHGNQITTSLPEVGHGAFTYFFLRALQDGKRNIDEVYAYLKEHVSEEAKRMNVDQTPFISPDPAKLKGRFVFVE